MSADALLRGVEGHLGAALARSDADDFESEVVREPTRGQAFEFPLRRDDGSCVRLDGERVHPTVAELLPTVLGDLEPP